MQGDAVEEGAAGRGATGSAAAAAAGGSKKEARVRAGVNAAAVTRRTPILCSTNFQAVLDEVVSAVCTAT
jgi:hypothetical protein